MDKTTERLLRYFEEKPYAIKMGAGILARRNKCSKQDIYKAKEFIRHAAIVDKPKAKILLLDIETAPVKAYVWRMWKENIRPDQVISDWFMLTWSAKWLGDEEVMSDRLTSDEAISENDERIIYSLWQLLNEAQIVIAHNGRRFDIPKIQSRFIFHGFPPTTPYKQIDTLEIAKRQFGFSSNKLDALASFFGFANKLETNFKLWKDCLEGDNNALIKMELYNRHDVVILENVYLKLRPYIHNHPNIALFEDKVGVCPYCGSNEINEIDSKYHFNSTTVNALFRCSSCGAVSRKAKNEYPKEFKNNLIRSI